MEGEPADGRLNDLRNRSWRRPDWQSVQPQPRPCRIPTTARQPLKIRAQSSFTLWAELEPRQAAPKVFDPMTGQLWVSRLELPGPLRDGGGAYDPLNRNIVFAGGYNASSIWRIPVGDGPQIKMARWDWPSAQPRPPRSTPYTGRAPKSRWAQTLAAPPAAAILRRRWPIQPGAWIDQRPECQRCALQRRE